MDWHRFDELCRQARAAREAGARGEAVRLLREALELWRGPALADLPGAGLDPIRARMTSTRAPPGKTAASEQAVIPCRDSGMRGGQH